MQAVRAGHLAAQARGRDHLPRVAEPGRVEGPPHARIAAAVFGVAGAVIDGRTEMLNLAWSMDAAALAERFRIPRVRLLNDLEALAFGMLHLRPDEVRVLSTGNGRGRHGTIGMIAPVAKKAKLEVAAPIAVPSGSCSGSSIEPCSQPR